MIEALEILQLERTLTAHSEIQYNKWKLWLTGEVKESDMFILAQTYKQEIYNLIGYDRFENDTNKNIFNDFAKIIQPPPNN